MTEWGCWIFPNSYGPAGTADASAVAIACGQLFSVGRRSLKRDIARLRFNYVPAPLSGAAVMRIFRAGGLVASVHVRVLISACRVRVCTVWGLFAIASVQSWSEASVSVIFHERKSMVKAARVGAQI